MFALCANNKLSRVFNIIILSLGRVQEREPSVSVGSEILSVRIVDVHQRINKNSVACLRWDLQLWCDVARPYRGPNAEVKTSFLTF